MRPMIVGGPSLGFPAGSLPSSRFPRPGRAAHHTCPHACPHAAAHHIADHHSAGRYNVDPRIADPLGAGPRTASLHVAEHRVAGFHNAHLASNPLEVSIVVGRAWLHEGIGIGVGNKERGIGVGNKEKGIGICDFAAPSTREESSCMSAKGPLAVAGLASARHFARWRIERSLG